MKFKKTIGILLVFVLLFSLAACANNNTSDEKNKQNFVIDNTAPNNLKIVYKIVPVL